LSKLVQKSTAGGVAPEPLPLSLKSDEIIGGRFTLVNGNLREKVQIDAKTPRRAGSSTRTEMMRMSLERIDDVREDVADRGSKQGKDHDDDDGDEDEDERILNQALTLFTRHVHHGRKTSTSIER
jgi:hypothetical protein